MSTKQIQRLLTMMKPEDEKDEVEAYDAEINEISPDELDEEVELSDEEDEEESYDEDE